MPKKVFRALAGVAAVCLLLIAVRCESPAGPDLKGGVLATFDVQDERFSIFITNSQTIDQVIALSNGQSNVTIPSGRVLKGRVDYNLPWGWHIDSQDITMANATVELCDGLPSYLEAHLDAWIQNVGYFCPWSAKLVSVKDYR
jgi:hypothetical protein